MNDEQFAAWVIKTYGSMERFKENPLWIDIKVAWQAATLAQQDRIAKIVRFLVLDVRVAEHIVDAIYDGIRKETV